MTAAQIASALNGRRVGKGKWMALCPAHSDRNRSLSIAEGRKVPVLLKCMSAGCDTRDILAAAGLKWQDLFDGAPSPELRQRMTLERRRDALERQLGLVIVLGAIEKEKRRYWAAAERRIRGELEEMRCWLEPDEVVREWRERRFQARLRQIGWDGIWRKFEASEFGSQVRRRYGMDSATDGIESDAGEVRRQRVHGRPPALQDGGLLSPGEQG